MVTAVSVIISTYSALIELEVEENINKVYDSSVIKDKLSVSYTTFGMTV